MQWCSKKSLVLFSRRLHSIQRTWHRLQNLSKFFSPSVTAENADELLSSILDRRVTSFPGLLLKSLSLSRSVGRVGENPGNEVGNRVENVHFMLSLHNRFALIEVRCSVRKLFSWPHVTKWCDNEAIACAICNDHGPTMTLLYCRTLVKFLYFNTHSLAKICCDCTCLFMWKCVSSTVPKGS